MRTTSKRVAFTLVELLVVITIIGILASLIVVAAVGALKRAQETRIKAELNQISDAFEEVKNQTTAYPPNCQTDAGPTEPAIDATKVFNDLKRYMRQVAPRSQEPDDLLRLIAGINPVDSANFKNKLNGGMTAGEAVVFWLGGFSSDPKFPISGEGGPSYEIPSLGASGNEQLDSLAGRTWIFKLEEARLAPRNDNNYFDQNEGRYIEYRVTMNGKQHLRRINFWQYTPAKSKQPFIYFDTSRYAPNVMDPPATPGIHVHALKKIENAGTTNERVTFVQPEKFQVLHCGIDDVWGDEFDRASYQQYLADKTRFFAFPNGPFTGDVADTVVNFTTQTKLEDAQAQ